MVLIKHFKCYSNPGRFRTLLALTRSSQLSLAMTSHVCAAAKNKFRRVIWRSIEINIPLLCCLTHDIVFCRDLDTHVHRILA